MKNVELMNKLSRQFGKVRLSLKKHSPEILLVTGVVGTVASTIMACKATTKIHDVLDETKENIEKVHQGVADGQVIAIENGQEKIVPYSQEDANKDLTIHYAKAGVGLAKLYGPAIMLGAASLTCILASHNIIHKRNVALTAAYATVERNFKDYRGRVVERFGEALDKELRYNIKAREIEEIVTDEEGNEKVVKTTIHTADVDLGSDYARFFDEYCLGWRKDADYNRMFVQQIQSWANDKLKSQGYLYLNDVYEMLGFEKTKAGQVVGWIYDESNQLGDNYVDFGLYDLHNEKKRDFINGRERSVLLDFNVDGNIWELMK